MTSNKLKKTAKLTDFNEAFQVLTCCLLVSDSEVNVAVKELQSNEEKV